MSNHDSFGQYKFLGLVSRNVHLILTFKSVLHEKNSVRRLMTMLKKLMVMMKYICGKFDLISAMIRSTISCIIFENGQINVVHETRERDKMVKHTQKIRRQFADWSCECV